MRQPQPDDPPRRRAADEPILLVGRRRRLAGRFARVPWPMLLVEALFTVAAIGNGVMRPYEQLRRELAPTIGDSIDLDTIGLDTIDLDTIAPGTIASDVGGPEAPAPDPAP